MQRVKRAGTIFFVLLLFCTAPAVASPAEDYEKAVKHYRAGEYRRAIPFFEKYTAEQPDSGAFYMLGYAYYETRDYDRARDCFDQVFLLDPGFNSPGAPVHALLTDDDRKLISSTLELAGTRKQIEHFAGMISSALPRLRSDSGSSGISSEVSLFLRESYRSNRIFPPVAEIFGRRYNRVHILSVLQWLKSPLGQKATALEVAANSPEALARSQTFRAEFGRLAGGRRRGLVDLEEALRATDLSVEIMSVSLFELLKGLQVRMQGRGGLTSEEIDLLVSRVRTVQRPALKEEVLASLAFTYSSLSDDELAQIAAFYRSAAGRWFNETGMEAMSLAVGRATRDLGEKMGSAFYDRKVTM